MPFKVITRNKQNLIYGVALAMLLFLLKKLEWHFLIVHQNFEIYAGIIAVIFTALGVWLASKWMKPKINPIIVGKTEGTNPIFNRNDAELKKLRISNRELEVLQLMAQGLSNQEIAEKLFLSLNTIKTHSSNLFLKLEVERRMQAVEKAKRLNLIP